MQEGDSYFSHPPLECADLQGVISQERNRRHSGTRPVATARAGAIKEWGQVLARPQSVLAASRQTGLLTAEDVAVGSSLDRRRSALFSPPAASPTASWRVGSS